MTKRVPNKKDCQIVSILAVESNRKRATLWKTKKKTPKTPLDSMAL